MNILEQCQIWHENDEYNKIIEAIEALPSNERTPELDSELARAYNNLAATEDRSLFKKAIALLKPHEEYFKGDHFWNFRIGYAYYYLDQEYNALPYFEQALAARPNDEDTLAFIRSCRKCLTIPRFRKNFSQRTAECWQAFIEGEAELRSLMDVRNRDEVSEQLMEKCHAILSLAFEDIAFELGFNGKQYELILSPEGNFSTLFKLVYFKRQAPSLPQWNIWVGRQASNGFALRYEDIQISADDVQVWINVTDKRKIDLTLYCEALVKLLEADEGRAWWFLSVLTDQTLGEINAMMLIDEFEVIGKPKAEAAHSLAKLPDLLAEKGFDLQFSAEVYLERSYIGYQLDPDNDIKADWRMDVYVGSTRCPNLINEYLNHEHQTMDAFHKDGAVPGFFCYSLDAFNDAPKNAVLDFRDMIEAAILKSAGEHAVTFTGGATGIYCGYLDFIAWDLSAVLDAAQAEFEASPISWANFHVFRRDAQTISLVDKEKADEDSAPTNSKLLS